MIPVLILSSLLAVSGSGDAGGYARGVFRPPQVAAVLGHSVVTGQLIACQQEVTLIVACGGESRFFYADKHLDASGIDPGDILEVGYRIERIEDGELHDCADSVRKLGRAVLPPPEKLSLAQLKAGVPHLRRVNTEAEVVALRSDDIDQRYQILVLQDGGTSIFSAYYCPDQSQRLPPALIGARVRLSGVWRKNMGGAARLRSPEFLQIDRRNPPETLRPAPDDPRAFPALAGNAADAATGLRRFSGKVIAAWGRENFLLRDAGGQLCRVALGEPGELPRTGSGVIAVGIPETDLFRDNLGCARWWPEPSIGDVSEPPVVELEHAESLVGERINPWCHGRRLRLRGRVKDIRAAEAVLTLAVDGVDFTVDCAAVPAALDGIAVDSVIAVSAVAVVESDSWTGGPVFPRTRAVLLVVTAADGITLVAAPPWWTPRRFLVLIAALLAVFAAAMVVIRIVNRLAMRRKVAERTRLAVELHDTLSQNLAGIACQVAAGRDALRDEPDLAEEMLGTAERMLESSRDELKNCLFDLRSDSIDDPDFNHAVKTTLAALETDARIRVRVDLPRSRLSDALAHSLLAIIRELTANAIRHGRASAVRVAGAIEADGTLRCSVTDNGGGFDPDRCAGPREGHFGLDGIRDRLGAFGGRLEISSRPGRTRALVSMPSGGLEV